MTLYYLIETDEERRKRKIVEREDKKEYLVVERGVPVEQIDLGEDLLAFESLSVGVGFYLWDQTLWATYLGLCSFQMKN